MSKWHSWSLTWLQSSTAKKYGFETLFEVEDFAVSSIQRYMQLQMFFHLSSILATQCHSLSRLKEAQFPTDGAEGLMAGRLGV